MQELESACSCKPIDWEGQFWKRTRSPACETWWDAHSILFDELHLKPWEWPAYQHPDAVTSYPEGSWAASNWKPDLGAQERYRILRAAAGLEHEDGVIAGDSA